jgi:hypothetical protein
VKRREKLDVTATGAWLIPVARRWLAAAKSQMKTVLGAKRFELPNGEKVIVRWTPWEDFIRITAGGLFKLLIRPKTAANAWGYGEPFDSGHEVLGTPGGTYPDDILTISSSGHATLDRQTEAPRKGNTGDIVGGVVYTWYRAPGRYNCMWVNLDGKYTGGSVMLSAQSYGVVLLADDAARELWEIARPKTATATRDAWEWDIPLQADVELVNISAGATRQLGYIWGAGPDPLCDFGADAVVLGLTRFAVTDPAPGESAVKFVAVVGKLPTSGTYRPGGRLAFTTIVAYCADTVETLPAHLVSGSTLPTSGSNESYLYGTYNTSSGYPPTNIKASASVRFNESCTRLIHSNGSVYSVDPSVLIAGSGSAFTAYDITPDLAERAGYACSYVAMDFSGDVLSWMRVCQRYEESVVSTCGAFPKSYGTTSDDYWVLETSWKADAYFTHNTYSASGTATGSNDFTDTYTRTAQTAVDPLAYWGFDGDLRKQAIGIQGESFLITQADQYYKSSYPPGGETTGNLTYRVRSMVVIINGSNVLVDKRAEYTSTHDIFHAAGAGPDVFVCPTPGDYTTPTSSEYAYKVPEKPGVGAVSHTYGAAYGLSCVTRYYLSGVNAGPYVFLTDDVNANYTAGYGLSPVALDALLGYGTVFTTIQPITYFNVQ